MIKSRTKLIPQISWLTSPVLILSLYAFLGMIGIFNHVMWRDEFNTWLIVRDSHSFPEMLSHVKYQGHTALWASCLTILRTVSESPIVMQVFHWAIAVLAVSIFWLFSPFTHRQKVLFTFGYIPFYQYFIIARPYVLGMLFLFMFCAIFPWRKKSYIPAAVSLALMANSSAYGLLIALALTATLAIEWIFDEKVRSRYVQQAGKFDLFLSLLIVAVGLGFAVYILIPPADSYNHGGLDAWKTAFKPRRIFRAWGRIFAGYTLIVPSQYKWADLITCGLITLLAIATFVSQLIKKPIALVFFGLANTILLAFTYLRFMGIGPRHFAHFYLVLVAAFWLYSYLPESDFLIRALRLPRRSLRISQRWCQPIFTTILVFQFLGGLYALPRDLIIPFSASKATANYIQSSGWQEAFIVASRDANMAPISGYLDRKLYYPEVQALGSFTLFGGDRRDDDHGDYLSHDSVLEQVEQLLKTRSEERILLILHVPLEAESEALAVQPIQKFTRAWTASERYYLYWAALRSRS